MTHRLTVLTLVFAGVVARHAAAQRPGTIEIGGGARYVNFDNSLGLDGAFGVGGQLAVYVRPGLALELDVSRSTADRGAGGSATYTPVRLRAVYNTGMLLLGGGLVRNAYGVPMDESDNGFSAILGLRYPLTDRLGLRFGADADVMFHPDDSSPFAFYTGNWGIHAGLSVRLAGGGAQ